jgi:hypothetical protein
MNRKSLSSMLSFLSSRKANSFDVLALDVALDVLALVLVVLLVELFWLPLDFAVAPDGAVALAALARDAVVCRTELEGA